MLLLLFTLTLCVVRYCLKEITIIVTVIFYQVKAYADISRYIRQQYLPFMLPSNRTYQSAWYTGVHETDDGLYNLIGKDQGGDRSERKLVIIALRILWKFLFSWVAIFVD